MTIRTIQFEDEEILKLRTALSLVTNNLHRQIERATTARKRSELERQLSTWGDLAKKVSCDDCCRRGRQLSGNDLVCAVCGIAWVHPLPTIETVVTGGLRHRNGTQATAAELKQVIEGLDRQKRHPLDASLLDAAVEPVDTSGLFD